LSAEVQQGTFRLAGLSFFPIFRIFSHFHRPLKYSEVCDSQWFMCIRYGIFCFMPFLRIHI